MMQQGIGRRGLLTGAGGLLAAPAIVRAQGQSNGVALVIGNSKYQWEATLQNVRRDAPDVAKTFQSYGLKTELLQDLTRDGMSKALDSFAKTTQGQNFGALYFAGHGASWERDSYLVPVDSDLSDPNTVTKLINSRETARALAGATNRLVVFDNCRNNPADGWRQLQSERNAAFSPEGARERTGGAANSLVLFSTAPGRIARDGPPGDNSPFAASFMRRFQAESIDLQSTPSKLRRDLLIATQGKQVLWDRNSYQQPFVLTAPAGHKSVAVNSGPSSWGADPSKIIELANAYGFAHENGYPLPSGLIAHRPAGNGADAKKVGSYKYETKSPLGTFSQLIIVMSVEEGQTAEIILSGKGRYNAKTNKVEPGSYWRFVTASISGDKMEFVPREYAPRVTFEWKDANGGTVSVFSDGLGGPNRGFGKDVTFMRLDG